MHKLSGRELRKKICDGDLTAEAVTKTFLDRIDKHNDKLGAFLAVYHDRALERSRALDKKRAAGEQLGRLAGIPIAVKDNIHVKNEISTCASQFLTNFRAPFDATVTRYLEAEGAIILGKTNMDEFAMGSSTENSSICTCHNPWKLDHVPGGTSGGSAVAVAARLCPIALGSDTGGSIRQPASYCGVTGFKPTYGRVSRFGLIAYGSSLDQIGPVAHHSEDIAMVMEVLGQHCDRDGTSITDPAEDYLSTLQSDLSGTKVGVPWQFIEDLTPEPRKSFEDGLEKLKGLGAEIVGLNLDIQKYAIAVYYILATAEASTNLARFDGIRYGLRSKRAQTLDEVYNFSKQEGFGPEVKRRIMLGTFVLSAGYQDAYYKKAQKVRTLIIEQYKKAFKTCDLIATPTTPTIAFKIGEIQEPLQMYLEDIYTIGANLGGLPGISVPTGFVDDMPLGMQLLGAQRQDVVVCNAAYAFNKVSGFEETIPGPFTD